MAKSDWIRLEQDKYSFFFQRQNIAGVTINSEDPLKISLLMVGDEKATVFLFDSVEKRNDKLNEIFQEQVENNEEK